MSITGAVQNSYLISFLSKYINIQVNGNIPGSASNHQNTSQQHIQTNGHYNTTPSSTHSMNNTGQPLNPNDPKFEVIIMS